MSAGRSIRRPPRSRGRRRSKVRQVGILPCRNQSWQPQDVGVNRKPSGLKKGWLVRSIGRASIEARNSIAMRDERGQTTVLAATASPPKRTGIKGRSPIPFNASSWGTIIAYSKKAPRRPCRRDRCRTRAVAGRNELLCGARCVDGPGRSSAKLMVEQWMGRIQCLKLLGRERKRQRDGVLPYVRRRARFRNCDHVAAPDRPRQRNGGCRATACFANTCESGITQQAGIGAAQWRIGHHRHACAAHTMAAGHVQCRGRRDCRGPGWSRSDRHAEHGKEFPCRLTLKLETPHARIFPAEPVFQTRSPRLRSR